MMKDEELSVFFAHSKLSGPFQDHIHDLVLIINALDNWANKPFVRQT